MVIIRRYNKKRDDKKLSRFLNALQEKGKTSWSKTFQVLILEILIKYPFDDSNGICLLLRLLF